MPATGTQLIDRTRRFMGDYPDRGSTSATISSTATTLSIPAATSAAYSVNMVIQIDQEALLVTSVASSVSLTVTRGIQGTTAATHASGATVLQKPRFLDIEYLDALNYAIQATWPWLYKPVIDDYSITTATDTYEYSIPSTQMRNELSDENSRFENTIGDWGTGGSNTIAVSTTQAFGGGQSALMTYQDSLFLGSVAFTATVSSPHEFSARIYVPSTWDGGNVYLTVRDFGASQNQGIALADMTLTNQWQKVTLYFTPAASDLVGALHVRSFTAPTAGSTLFMDNVRAGRFVGEIRHVARVEVKPPGEDEWFTRRRWSVRRGGFISPGNAPGSGSASGGEPGSVLVFKNLETNGSAVRLNGFGPFPTMPSTTSVLDPLFPSMAEYPLVEFAASYLMESGEARRVAQDRGLVDQREQANRVGASMQASQALQARFERRLQMVGMPPMSGYPHVQPYP